MNKKLKIRDYLLHLLPAKIENKVTGKVSYLRIFKYDKDCWVVEYGAAINESAFSTEHKFLLVALRKTYKWIKTQNNYKL